MKRQSSTLAPNVGHSCICPHNKSLRDEVSDGAYSTEDIKQRIDTLHSRPYGEHNLVDAIERRPTDLYQNNVPPYAIFQSRKGASIVPT